jgi:hypothetical protein
MSFGKQVSLIIALPIPEPIEWIGLLIMAETKVNWMA